MTITKTFRREQMFFIGEKKDWFLGVCHSFVEFMLDTNCLPQRIKIKASNKNPKKKGWVKANPTGSKNRVLKGQKFQVCVAEVQFLKTSLGVDVLSPFWVKVERV